MATEIHQPATPASPPPPISRRIMSVSYRFDLLHSNRSWREQVHVQFIRNIGNYFLRLDAVAGLIQSGRKSGNAAFAGRDGQNGAAHAALGGQADAPGPSPRPIE